MSFSLADKNKDERLNIIEPLVEVQEITSEQKAIAILSVADVYSAMKANIKNLKTLGSIEKWGDESVKNNVVEYANRESALLRIFLEGCRVDQKAIDLVANRFTQSFTHSPNRG